MRVQGWIGHHGNFTYAQKAVHSRNQLQRTVGHAVTQQRT